MKPQATMKNYRPFIDQRRRTINTENLWIVPYADFMSVLMILFLLMFAFAYAAKEEKKYSEVLLSLQAEMGGKVPDAVLREMAKRRQTQQKVMKFDEIVEKRHLDKFITVRTDTERIRITLNTPVLFVSGSAEVRDESRRILHEVAQIIKNIDNDVIVEGHTDNIPLRGTGRFKTNWELSQSRALGVIRYFVENEGLPAQRFAAAGYGEYRPLCLNDTDEHRSLNRRIEISILKSGKGA